MSDLKERLREMAPVGRYGPVLEKGLVCCNVIAEAADRIEELERALEQIANHKVVFDYVQAGAEGADWDKPGSPYDRGREVEASTLSGIALQALEQKP